MSALKLPTVAELKAFAGTLEEVSRHEGPPIVLPTLKLMWGDFDLTVSLEPCPLPPGVHLADGSRRQSPYVLIDGNETMGAIELPLELVPALAEALLKVPHWAGWYPAETGGAS